jgi:hypothetical protein
VQVAAIVVRSVLHHHHSTPLERQQVESTLTSRGSSICYDCALWISEITQPSSRVELRENSADLPLLRTNAETTALTLNCRYNGSDADTLNGKRALSGEPADDDGVASVPEVENLERDGRLGSLAGEEVCFGCEGQRAKLGSI